MAELPSTPADGNVKVAWVPAIADTSAPTVTELTAAGVVDLSCYLTADGYTPASEQATISDDRLCDTATYEQPGRESNTLDVIYIDNSNTTDPNAAYETLVPGTTGYIVVRRGKAFDAAFAANDQVSVTPVKCGVQVDLPPEANSVLRCGQKLFVTGPVVRRAAVVAGA